MPSVAVPVLHPGPLYGLPRPVRLLRRLRRRRADPAGQAQVRDVLAEFGLRARGEIERTAHTGRGQHWVIETEQGRQMLKQYKGTVEPDAVRQEHSILKRLNQVGFPVPTLRATPGGATLVQRGETCYTLFDFLDGYFQYHHYLFLPTQGRRFIADSARALGALHTTLRDFVPAGRNPNGFSTRRGERWRELDWFLSRLDACRQPSPDRTSRFDRSLADEGRWVETSLRQLDDRLRVAALPRLIIHGDYGPYNLFFKRGAPVVVLDFELARLDWRLTDLATALPSFAWNRLGFSLPKARCFVEAYREGCPASAAELRWLPSVWRFLTLRRVIVFWHRYRESGADKWLAAAEQKVALAHWIEDNEATLVDGLAS